ncbi:MAG: hypothetical protein L6Q98_18115 [Anaerolineae bacterium]|nr:hypothetical protein [Anaerolineae bacterium]NUQ07157.1 hypothetical protein [Anaerolineae bacterium]
MKKSLVLALVILALTLLTVPAASAQDIGELTVTCPNGLSFTNGVEFRVVQMRAGFDYRVTAIGINGFDPVLAVLNSQLAEGLCADDSPEALNFAASLPSSGEVVATTTSAQLTFHHTGQGSMENTSIVVGGYGDSEGQFILLIEGMAATAEDNAGDPFAIRITPAMLESNVPIFAYAIATVEDFFDPTLAQIDANYNVVTDSSGVAVSCDDAGTNNCYLDAPNLSDYGLVLDGTILPGGDLDSALLIDTSTMRLNNDPDLNFINLLVSSFGEQEGHYVLAIHVGTAED